MTIPNLHDSQQLAWLRTKYRSTRGWPVPATPYRLGMFAYRKQLSITDYGTHSARWIRLFADGLEAERLFGLLRRRR